MSDLDLTDAEVVATDVIRDFQGRIPYSQLARQVVVAAAPLIAAQVSERIAQKIDRAAEHLHPLDEDWPEGGAPDAFAAEGLRAAARIARGGAW